ncbi:XRE family transcriptional regulator [Paenibacillus sp. 1011MAR3C5]|uniref:helix-turn-helix domain-containing protein n=1 Tax=Paenibacillus sp. 1011MAR3C5 TaxID=1675787 RepID=UPI000E6B5084|nr:helix-turn-helix transcriptional regulator [Paenibacillus sp. 1011MAR3C5]RJE90730.1 XRE family transcriptional regulator [Paenibacillus sp. 1011MAR3C5]
MGFIPYVITEEDLKTLSGFQHLGEIHKYIRETAESRNPGMFTINALADKIGTSPSTLSRYESGKQRELKAALLSKIAQAISVPIEVFQLEYYMDDPRPFTICGITSSIKNFDLLEPTHRMHLSLKAYSPAGVMHEEVDEIVEMSVLEYEEFIEEVKHLIQKVRSRRNTWMRKKAAVEQMNITNPT